MFRLEGHTMYLAWDVTLGQKKLKICQIHKIGCCKQEKVRMFLEFIWPFSKSLGKDCSGVRNAALLALYI